VVVNTDDDGDGVAMDVTVLVLVLVVVVVIEFNNDRIDSAAWMASLLLDIPSALSVATDVPPVPMMTRVFFLLSLLVLLASMVVGVLFVIAASTWPSPVSTFVSAGIIIIASIIVSRLIGIYGCVKS
jgi:hypothetical protein